MGGGGGSGRWMDSLTGSNQFAHLTSSMFFCGGCELGVRGGGGSGRWMDSRTGSNQFAHSTSSKLGA